MSRSMNDARIFQISSLYRKAMNGEFFRFSYGLEDVIPYLIGDKGYPLFPWLMIPYTQLANSHHTIIKAFNAQQTTLLN